MRDYRNVGPRVAAALMSVVALLIVAPLYGAELKGVHEVLDPDAQMDDLGISVPIPISHPARRYPATDDFPTGPGIGARLPDVRLTNQHGETVDIHRDRRAGSSVVLFFRSAVW